MSKRIYASIVCCLLLAHATAASLSLNDLEIILNKQDWESVNSYVMAKGWEFYNSEVKTTQSRQLVNLTWAYEKSSWNDKALGWLNLWVDKDDNGKPVMVVLQDSRDATYSQINSSLKKKGYTRKRSDAEDGEVTIHYTSSSYLLEISMSRLKDDEDFTSKTIRTFTLYKKGGLYDGENGEKKTRYYDGSIACTYTLRNGKLNGRYICYHTNGVKAVETNFIDNSINGRTRQWNRKGQLEFEGTVKNHECSDGLWQIYDEHGTLTNKITGDIQVQVFRSSDDSDIIEIYPEFENSKNYTSYIYEDGETTKIHVSTHDNVVTKQTYKNDTLQYTTTDKMHDGKAEGICTLEVFIDDTTRFVLTTDYKNGKKDGQQISTYIQNGQRTNVGYATYLNDVQYGPFQEIRGDSLIIGNYNNRGELHGAYRVYCDPQRLLASHLIETDTTKINKVCSGQYINGKKSGWWRFYEYYGILSFIFNVNNGLIMEGEYVSDQRHGKWSYYYSSLGQTQDSIGLAIHAGELFMTKEYKHDLLDGQLIRYSIRPHAFDESKFKRCKVVETYKNDQLDGPYEMLDSLGNGIRGQYHRGKCDGEWSVMSDDLLLCKVTYKKGNWEQTHFIKTDGTTVIEKITSRMPSPSIMVSISNIRGKVSEQTWRISSSQLQKLDSAETVLIDSNLTENHLHGISRFFDESGNVIKEVEYDHGIVKREVYNMYEQNVSIVSLPADKNDETFYEIGTNHPFNGKVTMEPQDGQQEIIKVKKGMRDGTTKIINVQTGKTIRTIQYVKGKQKQ